MFNPRCQIIIQKNLNNKLLTKNDWIDESSPNPNDMNLMTLYVVPDKNLSSFDNVITAVDSITINSSLDNLTETADIYINKRYLETKVSGNLTFNFKRKKSSRDIIVKVSLNDAIDIYLTGNADVDQIYSGAIPNEFDMQGLLSKRFMGHVYSIAENKEQIILKCEDNMGILKNISRKTFNFKLQGKAHGYTQDLKGLIDCINVLWAKEFNYKKIEFTTNNKKDSVINYNLSNLQIQNMNPSEILNFIKSKYSPFVYFFRRNEFYAGFNNFIEHFEQLGHGGFGRIYRFTDPWYPGYDDQKNMGDIPDVGNGTNPVISSDLDFKTISNNKLLTVYSSNDPIYESTILTKCKLIVYYDGSIFYYVLSNNLDATKDKTISAKYDVMKSYIDGINGKELKEEDFQLKTQANADNQTLEMMQSFCKAAYQKTPQTGYSGSFTTFGQTRVYKGDLLLLNLSAKHDSVITDNEYDFTFNIKFQKSRSIISDNDLINDRNNKTIRDKQGYVYKEDNDIADIELPFWLYLCKGVDITYSTSSGYRQKIYIDKINPLFIKKGLLNDKNNYPDTVKTFIKKISII